MKAVVWYTDWDNDTTSPIDNIDVEKDYSAEQYIRDCSENGDDEWNDMLNNGQIDIEFIEEEQPMKKVLKNYEEIKNQLTEKLMSIDAEFRRYATDLILEYDPETQLGKLVDSPADNYRLRDNEYYLCGIAENFEDANTYMVESLEEAAEITEVSSDELITKAAEATDKDPDDVSLYDVQDYIKSHDDLYDKVVKAYIEWLHDDFRGTYMDRAEEMLSDEFTAEEE